MDKKIIFFSSSFCFVKPEDVIKNRRYTLGTYDRGAVRLQSFGFFAIF